MKFPIDTSVANAYDGRVKKPEPWTPCGYCFSRWATEMDHIIPRAFYRDNSDSNLYPSCHRCNCLLGARVFDSLEEKREWIREELVKRGVWEEALPGMPPEFYRQTKSAKIQQREVPKDRVGDGTPENKPNGRCRYCGEDCQFWKKKHRAELARTRSTGPKQEAF